MSKQEIGLIFLINVKESSVLNAGQWIYYDDRFQFKGLTNAIV